MKDISRKKGPVRVTWTCLGEGYNGDYDPNDPDDEMLLRLDVAIKNEETGEFDTVESRCTCFAANAPQKLKIVVLEVILEQIYAAYIKAPKASLRFLVDKLSHISCDQQVRPRYRNIQTQKATFPDNLCEDLARRTILDHSVETEAVVKALEQLPESPDAKQLLLLHYKEGKSLTQIGDIYGLSCERIRQKRNAALWQLRRYLES